MIKRKSFTRTVITVVIFILMISCSRVYAKENDAKDIVESVNKQDGVIEIYEHEEIGVCSTRYSLDWTINNNTRKYTTSFYKKAGTNVTISLNIRPSNKKVKIGYRDGNNDKHYVMAKASIKQIFTIKNSGNIRVFIENRSGEKITVTGYYIR